MTAVKTKIGQEDGMHKAIKEASPERVEFEVGVQGCRIQEVVSNNFNQILRGIWQDPQNLFRATALECSVHAYVGSSGGDAQLYPEEYLFFYLFIIYTQLLT